MTSCMARRGLSRHVALAWGGLTGGAEHPLHRLVSLYLPNRETDLAFASLVEQHGILAGSLAVLAAAVLVWRVVGASRRAWGRPAGLAAAGFAALVSVEVAVSVAGNLGLVPTAGVPFPILSYGGTAAAVHIAALGLVLALRADGDTHHLWIRKGIDQTRPRLLRTTAVAVTGTLLGMLGVLRVRGLLVQLILLLHTSSNTLARPVRLLPVASSLGTPVEPRPWGHGYATEAAGALLQWAFDTLDLNRVQAETDTRNAASARVLEKLGFVREGTLREDCVVNGEVSDSWVYGLIKREWPPPPSPDVGP